jgi:hypothetical protein
VGPQWRAVRYDVGRKSLPTIEVALACEVATARPPQRVIAGVLPSRRACDARAGGMRLDIIRGDLPAARRTVGFRLAALIRDGEIVVGLPPRRDPHAALGR